MRKLSITVSRFLDWYFEFGSDQENEENKVALAEKVIQMLYGTGTALITVNEIFEGCNKNAIRLSFLEGFEDDGVNHDIEVGELEFEFEINLID